MLTTARKSLSLSGGRIIIDQTVFPSYSPSGQHFPWEEDVDVINTPDIDPSFFTDDPFKKMSHNNMDYMEDKLELIIDQHNCVNDETSQHSNQQSFEDNVFIDLSQLISQTTTESLVSPNDVLQSAYMPSTEPVLHYMETNKAIESIISSVSIPVITTNSTSLMPSIDSNSSHSHSHKESVPLSQSSHPPQSLSPMMSHSYTTPSPALSYTSTTTSSDSYYDPSLEEMINTDSNTIDSLIETKPELSFLQPTVINDHLYTLPLNPSTSSSKRKRSTESTKDNKYMSVRKKNNLASKKSRITKRDKQKLMEEQITRYVEDNQKCTEMIARMEKEIEWCKNYLFKKVVSASKS